MKLPRIAIVASCLAFAAAPAFAQTNIDTRGAQSGTIAPFGPPDTQTYGQTITTTDMSVVTSFVFNVQCFVPTTARGHIYQWDSLNGHATGASAFDSAPFVIAGDGTPHDVTVNTGAVVLPIGTYVIFLSTSQDTQPDSGCDFGIAPDSTYSGGSFQFFNNGTDTSLWTSTTWDGANTPIDASFAVFFAGNQVPTMPQWVLMILIAMTTLAAVWMLRRRASLQFSR